MLLLPEPDEIFKSSARFFLREKDRSLGYWTYFRFLNKPMSAIISGPSEMSLKCDHLLCESSDTDLGGYGIRVILSAALSMSPEDIAISFDLDTRPKAYVVRLSKDLFEKGSSFRVDVGYLKENFPRGLPSRSKAYADLHNMKQMEGTVPRGPRLISKLCNRFHTWKLKGEEFLFNNTPAP